MPAIHRPQDTARALRLAFGPDVFGPAAAADAGVTRGSLRAATTAGLVRRLRRGAYVVADDPASVRPSPSNMPFPAAGSSPSAGPSPWAGSDDGGDPLRRDHLRRLDAVLAAHPGAVVSHASALVLHDLPAPGLRLPLPAAGPCHVTRPGWTGRRESDHRLHAAPVRDEDQVLIGGRRVTTLARTAVDVSRGRRAADVLITLDAAARLMCALAAADGDEPGGAFGDAVPWRERRGPERLRWAARDEAIRTAAMGRIRAAVEQFAGWPGIVTVRTALTWLDPGAENAFESASRALLLESGLPRPEAGLGVFGEDGRWYWADLAWPDLGVIGEADGRGKYIRPEDVYREKRREDALRRSGWLVVRWSWDDLLRRPDQVVARVRRALREGGGLVRAVV